MAKGPGTKNSVGKVGVTVVPDTSKFSQELKAKLEQIEQKTRLEVPLDLDHKNALRQWEALKAKIEAQNLDVRANIKTSGLNNLTKNLGAITSPETTRTMGRLATTLRRIGDNAERFAQALVRARQHAAINASLALQLAGRTLRAALSAESAKNAWQALSRAVSAVGDAVRRIPRLAGLARDLALAGRSAAGLAVDKVVQFAKAAGQASTYTELWRKAQVGVNRVSLETNSALERMARSVRNISFRGIVNGAKNAGTAVKNLGFRIGAFAGQGFDRAVLAIGKGVKGAFEGLARTVSGAGEAFGSAASSMIHLGKTGILLVAVLALIAPILGLISALIAGLPSLVFAFGGAIAAVALGFDGIQKAAKVLGDDVSRLKKALADTFAKGLAPVFKQMEKVFPVLQKGLVQVAKGLIPLAQAFTDVVTSAAGMGAITRILENTGKFFSDLAPAVRDFTTSFITLGDVGASKFGVLSGLLNRFADDWATTIARVADNGTLGAAIEGLGRVVSALLGLFTRLFEVGLDSMARLAQPLTNFIDGFTTLFVALAPILNAISDLVFTVFGELFRAIAPVVQELAPGLVELGRVLGDVIVGAIKALMPVVTPLAKILGEVLITALKAIAPILPPLIDFLRQLADTVGKALMDAFALIQPVLKQVSDLIGQLWIALAPLLPDLIDLAKVIAEQFIKALTDLMPILLRAAQEVFPALVDIVKQLVPHLGDIIKAVAEILPKIVELGLKIIEYLIPIMRDLRDFVKAVWPEIKDVVKAAMDTIKGVIEVVMGIITGDWERAWNGLWSIIKAAGRGFVESVDLAINGVLNFFRHLGGDIVNAMGDLGGLLVRAGTAIIQGFLRGLKSAWGDVTRWVGGIADWIAANKGPISYDRRLLIPAGLAIMQGLQKGLTRGFSDVQSLVTGMAGQLETEFNGMQLGARADIRGAYDATGSVQGKSRDELIAGAIERGLAAMAIEIDSRGVATVVKRGASLNYAR
jgi:phage-related protein